MEMAKDGLQSLLSRIPSVETILGSPLIEAALKQGPRGLVVECVRTVLKEVRRTYVKVHREGGHVEALSLDEIARRVLEEYKARSRPSLRRLINATGVIVHTNLGRSILCKEALDALAEVASSYSNLEYNLSKGQRGSRYVHVEEVLCSLTGAEAALVVNNNAAAVLISLNTLAEGREVVVSRGELVEIGGSFRMPEVMRQSGARLVEIGTTNKTHLRDYENALSPDTALILKVHTSNYRIMGFTANVDLKTLVDLGRRHGIPVMEDLGSGCLVDLQGLVSDPEPTVQRAVQSGVDLVTFSGDKLLGGPQAGIILGRKEVVERIRRNPLNRALRIDKLTLAALEATLRLYLEPERAMERIPTLCMLSESRQALRRRALRLARMIRSQVPTGLVVSVKEGVSQVGGGAMPTVELPTWVVAIRSNDLPVTRLERRLRGHEPPIIARIAEDELVLDVRTFILGDMEEVASALKEVMIDSRC